MAKNIVTNNEEISDEEFEQMLSSHKGLRDRVNGEQDDVERQEDLKKQARLRELEAQEALIMKELNSVKSELEHEPKTGNIQEKEDEREKTVTPKQEEIVVLRKVPEPSVPRQAEPIPRIETKKMQGLDERLLSIPDGISGDFQFPDGFLWGTSTSAYQIEGGVRNDWSEWECSPKRKKDLDLCQSDARDHICGQACDFWQRYDDDFALAKDLGTNAVRIGLEWARIETGNDMWDVDAVKKYREILESARKKGFKIVLTIWHWTNPVWFAEEGGWSGKNAVLYFERFSAFAVKEFGGYVDYWVTLNEPMVHISNGYLTGKFPPNRHNVFKAQKAFNNLVRGHKRAYKNIHKIFPEACVSITGLLNDFEPALKWGPVNILLANLFHYFWNHRFLRKIKKYLDYIGMDYYFHDRIVCYPPFKKNINDRVTDMDWEIYPKGIYHVLKYLRRFHKPVIIMENGLADADDRYRAAFIKEHLYWVYQAIREGVDVRGYFHWSLLDNFEWAAGYAPKFGLYAVDRKTLARTMRPSAAVYKQICKENKLEI